MHSNIININIGLLGHVDSGKTSLAKALTEISSTACFDKHPQSQERGITIDLGFSSFSIEATETFKQHGYEKIQFTLVDCPGHASLIRTIIGGVHIIDIVILVVDVNKGIQTQTAECLVISQITKKPLMAVLNKIDVIEPGKRDEIVNKVKKKLNQTLTDMAFKDTSIVPIVAKEEFSGERGISVLIEKLKKLLFVPKRLSEKPFILAVDHCFLIKGKGTILTGTVLQGTIRVNDDIEIPSLNEIKKVKSIQMFKNNVLEAVQGDRIGVCVKQFEPSQLERGLACQPSHIPLLYGAIITFNKVKYFKGHISSNRKYHISIGHETVIGRIKLFSAEDNKVFGFDNEYAYIDDYNEEIHKSVYTLIEFDKSVYVPLDSIVIGSKLDVSIETKSCRLAFFGSIVFDIKDKNYAISVLPSLKLYVEKEKCGVVQNVLNDSEVVAIRLFKKHSSIQKFMNFKVTLSTGETGYIQGLFGQKDKVRIAIPGCLNSTTIETLSSLKKNRKAKQSDDIEQKLDRKEPITLRLCFKRYIFDKDKTVSQKSLF